MFYLQPEPTGRSAKCRYCDKKLSGKLPRIVYEYIYFRGYYRSKYYCCYECASKRISDVKILRDYNRLINLSKYRSIYVVEEL